MLDHGEIIFYQPNDEIKLEVRVEYESVWLSIQNMSQLFGRDVSVIGKHIRNVFKEGELSKESVWAKFAYTASDGKTYQVDYYNLDVIISVGYRVKSIRGTQFRIWASKVLKDYLLNGVAINQHNRFLERIDKKLQEHDNHFAELDKKIDFFVHTSLPPIEGIFYEGQIFDAYAFAINLIRSAQQSIQLIDNYVDDTVLTMLSKRNRNVTATIYTRTMSEQLRLDVEKHNQQYERINVQTTKQCHDRFLIIDDKEVYHIGASLKDLGKKMFAFSKLKISPSFITKSLK